MTITTKGVDPTGQNFNTVEVFAKQ